MLFNILENHIEFRSVPLKLCTSLYYFFYILFVAVDPWAGSHVSQTYSTWDSTFVCIS